MEDNEEERYNEIITNYKDVKHPTAFAGRNVLYRYYKGRYSDKDIEKALEHIDSYTRHKELKKPNPRNPFFIHYKRQQVQGDLIDLKKLSRTNEGVKFLAAFIDSFTKKAWVYPMKDKSAQTMESVFEKWLEEDIEQKPESMFCDRGTEFKNRRVKTFFETRGIKFIHPNSEMKAAIVERFNRTIENMIFKYMTEFETEKYIDKLDDLVTAYNNRGHRTLKFLSPEEAEKNENQNKIRKIHRQRYDELEIKNYKKEPKYAIGDMVRVKKLPTRFARGYEEQFNSEYFRIVSINKTLPIVMYNLESMNTGEQIEGGFYANELSKVRGSVFKVIRVLRRRRRNGRLQYLVRWKDFGPRHDSWVNEDDITATFAEQD